MPILESQGTAYGHHDFLKPATIATILVMSWRERNLQCEHSSNLR